MNGLSILFRANMSRIVTSNRAFSSSCARNLQKNEKEIKRHSPFLLARNRLLFEYDCAMTAIMVYGRLITVPLARFDIEQPVNPLYSPPKIYHLSSVTPQP